MLTLSSAPLPTSPPDPTPPELTAEDRARANASPDPEHVHLGAGWTVAAQTAEQTRPAPDPAAAASRPPPAPLAALPQAGIRPARTLDMVRETRRARAMAIGAAVAVQGAMIVYGIMRMLDQRDEARTLADQEPEPFNPYPR